MRSTAPGTTTAGIWAEALGLKFSDRLAAIRTCGGGTVIFSNQSFAGDDLKTISNIIPAEICTEFEVTKDDEDVNDDR